MKTLFIYFTFLPYILFSQQISKESRKWLNESLNDSTVDLKELKADFVKRWAQRLATRFTRMMRAEYAPFNSKRLAGVSLRIVYIHMLYLYGRV